MAMRQPYFLRTSRGLINLMRVLHIKPAERGMVRFEFGCGDFVDVPEQEVQRIEVVMIQECMICGD
jgi:hypothetical protein